MHYVVDPPHFKTDLNQQYLTVSGIYNLFAVAVHRHLSCSYSFTLTLSISVADDAMDHAQ